MSEPADRPRRVLAAGLSPAWQQVLAFDEFHVGQVNRASEVHWCGSGKVLNVAIALARLARGSEVECRALSVIGRQAREAIEPEFAALGVSCRWVETAAETRICTTIVERARGRTTELVENAPPLRSEELSRFRDAFVEEASAADVVVLTGSLPEGVPATFYRDLLQATSAKVVLDARGAELLESLECRPLVAKPNREELGRTMGGDFQSDDELGAAMRELNGRGAEWVVVTDGPKSIWASHRGESYRLEPLEIEQVVNPIGSGDCLAAGMAFGMAAGRNMIEAIRFGIAAAAENVGQLLPGRIDAGRVARGTTQVSFTPL